MCKLMDTFSIFPNHYGIKLKNLVNAKGKSLKKTKILIFVLKLIPFMKPEEKLKFFEKIEEYYFIDEYKFNSNIKYFKKNWL